MLSADDAFTLGGESIRAIVTGNSESAISTRYLSVRGFTSRIQDGCFNEAVSVQTLGGFFTCLVSFRPREMAADVDITLGLDWLAYFREHLFELDAIALSTSAVGLQPSSSSGSSLLNMTIDPVSMSADQGEMCCTECAPQIIRQTFCEDTASFFSNDDTLTSLLAQHGVLCDQFGRREQRSMLVHHLLYGQCSKFDGIACKSLCRSGTEVVAFGKCITNLVLNEHTSGNITLNTFKEICYVLGFRTSANQTLSMQEELLKFFRNRLEAFSRSPAPIDTTDCLNEQEAMIKSSLVLLASSHGMQCSGSLEDLRSRLFSHICTGQCKVNLNNNIKFDACRSVVDQVPPVSNENFTLALIASIIRRLSGRALRWVAAMQGLPASASVSVSKLRRLVKKHLVSTAKGKRVLERSTLNQAIDERQSELNRIRARWPEKKSDEFLQSLVDQFKRDTSSSALSNSTCACCSENVLLADLEDVPLEEIDLTLLKRPDCEISDTEGDDDEHKALPPWLHPDVISPSMPFPDGLLENILVDPKGVMKSSDGTPDKLSLCHSCKADLAALRIPRLALANRLFIGAVPDALKDLTTIEESMISLCRAKCTIIHLKNDGSDDTGTEAHERVMPNHQRGMRGHVIMHAQRPDVVAELLPPSIEDIVSPICVIYTGATAPTQEWLKEKAKPLAVRADKVRKALVWLKKHNYLYRHITINWDVLDEIRRTGHLPFHVEHIPPSPKNTDASTSGYVNNQSPSDNQTGEEDIPFESVLITDVDGHASANVLRAAAIRHFNKLDKGYLEMPHNAKPENEFWNPQLFPKLYPTLFPYGIGGFEDPRRLRRVSLKDQTRHFLNLTDSRFQTHPSFMFMVFNVLQRRQVLLNTSTKMKKSSFESIASDFVGISADDIEEVTSRVSRGDYTTAYTNNEKKVLRLMREVKLVNRNVQGSNVARLCMRNEIRSLMISHGFPSFFITINPADVYNPLVKFLAGHDIDIDKLLPAEISNYWDQSVLIAKNPVVAAKFFDIYVKAFIKTILGFDPERQELKGGVLGVVKAHYGCVEAQGRGTLHCHMLVWLEGGLDPNALKQRLLDHPEGEFQRRLVQYLDSVINTELPTRSNASEDDVNERVHPCQTRGPHRLDNEDDLSFAQRVADDYAELAKTCQQHQHRATCYKNWKGPPNPKTCRFELDPDTIVEQTTVDPSTGELTLRKLDGMVANFNTTMLRAIRCNMDIKFMGSGADAKAVIYYITDYISKSQLKAHVAYATLELAVKKLAEFDPLEDDVCTSAKKLLTKCCNAMIGLQELSAPQVSSYLLGYGDHYTSHSFKQLFWKIFETHLDRESPSPECYPNSSYQLSIEQTTSDIDGPSYNGLTTDMNEEVIGISLDKDKTLVPKGDQVADYIYRGHELQSLNLWDFISQVEKIRKQKQNPVDFVASTDDNESDVDEESDDDELDSDGDGDVEMADVIEAGDTVLSLTSRSRPTCEFMTDHVEQKSHVLRVRQPNRRLVPVMIGPALPRRNVETHTAQYSRIMLLLFKPWREVSDLKNTEESWETAFAAFVNSPECDSEILDIMNNMQLMHECKDSRDGHMKNRNRQRTNIVPSDMIEASRTAQEDDLNETIQDEALHQLLMTVADKNSQKISRSTEDVNGVLTHLENSGLCQTSETSDMPDMGAIELVTNADSEKMWKKAYDDRKANWKERQIDLGLSGGRATQPTLHKLSASINSRKKNNHGSHYGELEPRITLHVDESNGQSSHLDDDRSPPVTNNLHVDIEMFAAEWSLNSEQTLAFKIMADHSNTLNSDPLRMYLAGPAGTGKTRVFNALKAYFEVKGEKRRFRVCSYMGVAARNVSGMTLHAALNFNHTKRRLNAKAENELRAMWEGVDFLLIDEVSMISCEFLYEVSEALSRAKGDPTAFGGINVIFAGDFAQLPPVRQTRLYSNLDTQLGSATGRTQKKVLGQLLWLSVDTVVELTEIMRQVGASNDRFVALLGRLRKGQCTDEDYTLLKSRIISPLNNVQNSEEHWRDAPMIVSENATKDALNEKLATAFANRTGQTLHWYHATDRIQGKVITDENVLSRLESLPSSLTNQRLGRIPLVLGLPVMVMQNFDVEAGVVNGSKGYIHRIRYKLNAQGNRMLLSCVVKIPDSDDNPLPELDPHDIPILEDTTYFVIQNPYTNEKMTIQRTQVPLVPAFAMTAHKAQGQTMTSAIIDLAACRGTQAPYVMVSRVTSLDGLLILRPFKKEKICCCPSQEVRREFDRLKTLILQTKMRNTTESDVIRQTQLDLTEHTDELRQRRKPLAPSKKRLALRNANKRQIPMGAGSSVVPEQDQNSTAQTGMLAHQGISASSSTRTAWTGAAQAGIPMETDELHWTGLMQATDTDRRAIKCRRIVT